MRILAVRGRNLASLPQFSINFEEEPIGTSGIFAITGPTGSGKSTILDAICLALYDELPRLSDAESGLTVGKENDADRLRYNDVRSVMRHGAAEASAEVDFVGQDGRRYCARWEVRRAKGHAAGRIQSQKISLKDLESGDLLGDKKSDTLGEIEKRIGLGFEQFKRAVLLAQGEFDAFVRADSKERAELLERITGTQIYTAISIAAFNRAKQEKQELETLHAQAGEYRPLTEEGRAQLEQQINSTNEELRAEEERKKILQRAAEWFAQHDHLDSRVQEAHKSLEATQQAFDAAEVGRVSLKVCNKGVSLRAEMESVENEQSAAARLADQVTALTGQRTEAETEQEKARAAQIAAAHDAELKSTAYDDIGPQLDLAKELDAKIEERSKHFDQAQKEWQALTAAAETSENDHRSAVSEKQHIVQEQEAVQLWQLEHRTTEILASQLDAVTAQLRIIRETSVEIEDKSQGIRDVRKELGTALGKRDEGHANIAELDRRIVEIDTGLERLEEELARHDRPAMEARKDAAHAGSLASSAALSASTAWIEATTLSKAEQDEQERQRRLADEFGTGASTAFRELNTTESVLDEARRNLDLSTATASNHAELLRTKLADGKPCPVCGSLEHPMHAVSEVLRQRVEADKARVAGLAAAVRRLTTQSASASAQKQAATEVADAASLREIRARDNAVVRQREWTAALFELRRSLPLAGLSIDIDLSIGTQSPVTVSAIRDQIAEVEASLSSRLQALSTTESSASSFRSDREGVRSTREKQNENVSELSLQITGFEHEVVLVEQKLADIEQRKKNAVAAADGTLGPIFTDWMKQLSDSPDDFESFCSRLAFEWKDKQERLVSLHNQLNVSQSRLATLEATSREKRDGAEVAKRRYSEASELLQATTIERSKVIAGRPHTEVRTAYRVAKETAQTRLNTSTGELHRAERALLTLQTELASVRQQRDAALGRLIIARKKLDDQLLQLSISEEQVREALRLGDDWIQAEGIRLRGIEDARMNCHSILSERRDALTNHQGAGRPLYEKEELIKEISASQPQIELLNATLIQARAARENDRQSKERVAELKQLIETKSDEAGLWSSLNELVGSADGAKFRRFAQSITFEQLVQFANSHLAELKPRYELQRTPANDHLGLQVVDHDMADEVRGVHSLSGGERFLISLALALGLASMSSNQGVRVESLFIDEGFGALDSASLGVALSALEHLQASGRTIGVISHVEDLKERIAVKVEVTPDGNGRSSVSLAVG